MLVFQFLIGISETFLCSMSALLLKIVLLDGLQLLMLFAGTLTYLRDETLSLFRIL
jgi:hypothetical protein